jgi:DNA polymerase-3 subunit delta
MSPAFKSAYLIHGDDHGRISERRARLRALAEAQSGVNGVEMFEGDGAAPDSVAAALNALTFAIGRRFLIVDGAEKWKDKELDDLEAAIVNIAPDTTITFFAREDGRLKTPKRLHDAVKKVGGDIATEAGVKPWELPKWVVGEAGKLNLRLTADAARALVAGVGERQQRLLRELEKLELDLAGGQEGGGAAERRAGGPIDVDADTIAELTAASSERKAWAIGDAMVAGDAGTTTRLYLELRGQGERLPGLIFMIASRLRQAHQAAVALEAGRTPSQIKSELRMPPKAAEKLIADARRLGADKLRRAIERVADLEVASRGGGPGGAGEDTHALIAISALST